MVFRMMHVKDSLSYQRGKPFDPLRLPVYVQFQGGCPCWPLDLQLKASPEESYLASAEEVLKGIQADFLSCFFFSFGCWIGGGFNCHPMISGGTWIDMGPIPINGRNSMGLPGVK